MLSVTYYFLTVFCPYCVHALNLLILIKLSTFDRFVIVCVARLDKQQGINFIFNAIKLKQWMGCYATKSKKTKLFLVILSHPIVAVVSPPGKLVYGYSFTITSKCHAFFVSTFTFRRLSTIFQRKSSDL